MPPLRLLKHLRVLAPCLLLLACDHAPEPDVHPRAAPVALPPGQVRMPKASLPFLQIATVASEPEAVQLRVPGRVAFRDAAMSRVGTPVTARVAEVHVTVGAVVHAGDPLVTLSSPQAAETRAQVEHSRLQIRLSQEMVRRQKDMLAHGVGIDSERFQAEMQLAQAQADLRKYENEAALLGEGKNDIVTLRAPIDGSVIVRRASVGATVDPSGEPLIEIGNPQSLWVVADVFEQDLALVRVGAEATVDLAAAATPLQGNVASVAGRVEAGQRRVPVYVALDMPIGASIRPGMYALVHIQAAPATGVVVPASAVLVKDGTHQHVYVEREPGLFEAREVQLGRSFDGRLEVVSGIKAGERIVTGGALLLDGSAEQRL